MEMQEAAIVLVTPLWRSQPWFAALPYLCLNQLRLLPARENLIITLQETDLPFPYNLPRLVAWLVSGANTRPWACPMVPYHYCSPLGGDQQIETMPLPGISGSSGAQTTTEILFLPL